MKMIDRKCREKPVQNRDLDRGERKPGADIREIEVAQRGVERGEATTLAAS